MVGPSERRRYRSRCGIVVINYILETGYRVADKQGFFERCNPARP